MRTFFLFIILICASFFSVAQSKKRAGKSKHDKLNVTPSGLQYKIIYDSLSKKVQAENLVLLHIKYNNGTDSLNTYTAGRPVSLIADTTIKGGLEEGMLLVSKGDSALFVVENEILYKKTFRLDSLPKGITKGSKTTFTIKVIDVMNAESLKKRQTEQLKKRTEQAIEYMNIVKKDILDSSAVQLADDDKLIQNYIKTNKLNAQKTPSGIYYVITNQGNGDVATPGDSALVHYVGKLLNGKEFDKSNPESPLYFQTSVGNVIPGFDEPMSYIKEGSKATILIPSSFAYGTQGVRNTSEEEEDEYIIPPNSVLLFDIEVLDYSKIK